ncbi:MAG: hypothetical protein IKY83_14200 [Proteobacteria bacterium]|nr:hypothetical protein [Pseudomonadota bacterium]
MERRLSGRRSESGQGYAGYGAEPDTDQEMVKETKALERDLTLEEYRDDRDAILAAIKVAIRERRYSDAQEFVYKYRVAAKSDESFSVLAEMTAKGLEEDKELEKLKVSLDATPDSDYEVRLSISERMYRLRKDPKVLEDVNKYRKHLNKPLISEDGSIQVTPDLKDQVPKVARTVADTVLAILCGAMSMIALLVGLCVLDAGRGHSGIAFALLLCQIAVHCATMVNWRHKKITTSGYVKKFVGNIIFFITMICIVAVVG